MIQVCFPSLHHQPAQKDLLPWQLFRRRFHLKVTDRDFVDRWLLDLIMSTCGFRHACYPQSSVLTVDDAPARSPDGWTTPLWQHRSNTFSMRRSCSTQAFKEKSRSISPAVSPVVAVFPHASEAGCQMYLLPLKMNIDGIRFPSPFFTQDGDLLRDLVQS